MSSFADLQKARKGRRPIVTPRPAHTPSTTEIPADRDGRNEPLQAGLAKTTIGEQQASQPTPTETPLPQAQPTASSSSTSIPSSKLPQYPDIPESVEVRQSATSGRGIYVKSGSTKKIKAGTTILSTKPYTAVLTTHYLPTYCSGCFLSSYELAILSGDMTGQADGKELKKCSRCQSAWYCSKECQTTSWPSHQTECRALTRFHTLYQQGSKIQREPLNEADLEWIPEESVRALGRICWMRKGERAKMKGDGPEWAQIEALQSHRSILSDTAKTPFAALVRKVLQYISAGEPLAAGEAWDGELKVGGMDAYGFGGAREMMDLCCAFASNSFTLSTPSLTPIGVAISPLIALINHSCAPNAVVVFPFGGRGRRKDGKCMEVIALRELEEGEEILTSYVDLAQPRDLRRQELKERYHFDCVCSLCEKTGEVDPRGAVLHPGCKKDGKASMDGPINCDACGETFKISRGKLDGAVKRGREIIAADAKMELEVKGYYDVQHVVETLKQYVPPSTDPLFSLLNFQAGLLGQGPGHFTALEAKGLAWKGYELVYPYGHPSRGLALAELGKLLNHELTKEGLQDKAAPHIPRDVRGRRALARETFIMAMKELRVGFGADGGLVGKEVEALIEGISREIAAAQHGVRGY